MKKIFVIIPHWENDSDTRECIESLKNSDYPNMRIVAVDNGSSKPFSADGIHVIRSEENVGFAGGSNIGIGYALKNGAEYVLLLNNDTIVDRSFLTKLVKIAETNEKIGILGPKIYMYSERNRIWFAGGEVNWLRDKATMRGVDEIDHGQFDSPDVQDTKFVTGCCLLIKREVVEKIGMIPEEYFLYYEDVAWSFLARRSGYRCVFVPSSRIWHKVSRGSVAGSKTYVYYHVRNGLLFAKNFAPWYVWPFLFSKIKFKMTKQFFKILFFPSKREWASATLAGIKDFALNKTGKNDNWH